ncbi:MAG: hypothetical protein EPN62_05700 [Candidimonas sp.]|nr:MAG: hypothetical protein EPN77_16755 [Candidimonas sp.]TAM24801.1 MAG: hypothetical protein EPN62_05700 [Candidimonas sp.]
MSRSGYNDDCDERELAMWRGAVTSALRGKRGQQFLRELATTMDAMEEKALIAESFHDTEDGGFCTLGTVGAARKVDMKDFIDLAREEVGEVFGIAPAMAAEIMYENDEGGPWGSPETPEARWQRMRNWVQSQITPTPQEPPCKP